jgi:hypothetical protein
MAWQCHIEVEGGIARRLEADLGGGTRRDRVRSLFAAPVGIADDALTLRGLVAQFRE